MDDNYNREEWVKTLKVGSEAYVVSGWRNEEYEKVVITGETSRSWVVQTSWRDKKIPKKTAAGLYSPEDVMRIDWIETNRRTLVEGMGRLHYTLENFDKLRAIAEILGVN